ncbi:hypothetical protein GALL_547160 [mine drainage metagenome]|uniref:Uncharacterized protein n=1 Tax=mine drainage metagenome TaxID=410659 RepID=A0A1J5NY85_9ZZZZ
MLAKVRLAKAFELTVEEPLPPSMVTVVRVPATAAAAAPSVATIAPWVPVPVSVREIVVPPLVAAVIVPAVFAALTDSVTVIFPVAGVVPPTLTVSPVSALVTVTATVEPPSIVLATPLPTKDAVTAVVPAAVIASRPAVLLVVVNDVKPVHPDTSAVKPAPVVLTVAVCTPVTVAPVGSVVPLITAVSVLPVPVPVILSRAEKVSRVEPSNVALPTVGAKVFALVVSVYVVAAALVTAEDVAATSVLLLACT